MSTIDTAVRQACIGLGSNQGNPSQQIEEAVQRLDDLPGCRMIARSSLYRSAPFGPVRQPDFLNAVVVLETGMSAQELLQALQEIENMMGRVRGGQHWGPRVIDLDLLTVADEQIDQDGLTVPHPGIALRNFVLLPLREVAPQLVIPGLGPLAGIVINHDEPRIERIA